MSMRIEETYIQGVFDVIPTSLFDERGSFTRLYDPEKFAAHAIKFTSVDVNLSRNTYRGTLRGLHFQDAPWAEAKLVRVTAGKIYDVVVDVRRGSVTRGRWLFRELTARECNALFIPEGCAHGFITLENDTDVLYQMSRRFEAGHGKGYRFDDPAFAINWPLRPTVLSVVDRSWPSYSEDF